jgi:hypothetical protein
MPPMARHCKSLPPFVQEEPRQAARGADPSVPNRVPTLSRSAGVGGSRGKCIGEKDLAQLLHRANFRRRLSWDATAASVLPSCLSEGFASLAGFRRCSRRIR